MTGTGAQNRKLKVANAMTRNTLRFIFVTVAISACKISPGQTPHRFVGNENLGAIGSGQPVHGGVHHAYSQPVRITAPPATVVSLASEGHFDAASQTPVTVGLLLRQNYRLMVAGIPNRPGQAVYPSIELLDRLHPPAGMKAKYPIPIELTADELRMAVDGKMVTRIIYLEDPRTALPIAQSAAQPQDYFEVAPSEDPVQIARRYGRPMAILRIGSRVPDPAGPDAGFLFGSPVVERFEQEAAESLPPIITAGQGRGPSPRAPSRGPALPISRAAWPLVR